MELKYWEGYTDVLLWDNPIIMGWAVDQQAAELVFEGNKEG